MRYAIAVLAIIFVTVVGIVLLSGRDKNGVGPSPTVKASDYADNANAAFSYTTQGNLVGQQQRRSIKLIITSTQRTMEELKGYEGTVGKKETVDNTQAAYSTFLKALDNFGFGRNRSVRQPDDQGVCPFGLTYIYQIDNTADQVMRTWSDNCSKADGTFAGNPTAIRDLFQNQFANYDEFASGINL